jgi:FkbM family methyltransferase
VLLFIAQKKLITPLSKLSDMINGRNIFAKSLPHMIHTHIGDTGLYLAYHLQKSFPEKSIEVIMIEPDNTKTVFIQKMIELNKLQNCVVITCGISDKEYSGSLIIQVETPTGSIPIYTIDKLLKDIKISMMHIDVEGMEYKLLKGSKNTLQNVKYVFIEMNDIPQKTMDTDIHAHRDKERLFLKDNNFIQIENPDMYTQYNNELYIKNLL